MLSFFKRGRPASTKGATRASVEGAIDPKRLWRLVELFPIGGTVLLRPEYQEAIELDSIVVGYQVNGQLVYGNGDIERQGEALRFHSAESGAVIERVESFALLVPLENSNEGQLDYARRSELKRIGLFRRGNTITLVTLADSDTLFAVDSTVASRKRLPDGLYSNHEVAVLTLEPDTLKSTERRKYQRLQITTEVPASIRAVKGQQLFDCQLRDYAEGGCAVQFEPQEGIRSLITLGKRVYLEWTMPSSGRHYRVEGVIAKADGEEFVVQFRRIEKSGNFATFTMIDAIEIKTALEALSN